jgi:uncharacterized protein YebE (UPF0316 family)
MASAPALSTLLDGLGSALAAGGLQAIPPGWMPVAVFSLRAIDLTLATLRMLAVVQGRRLFAWITGFLQALFFLSAVAGVLVHLNNLWNVVGYAAGFATGGVLGLWLESRFGASHSLIRVVSPHRGAAVADALHHEGFGATELSGSLEAGMVSTILCYVPRRKAEHTRDLVVAIDPQAFVTVERVRAVGGGWKA